LFLSTQIPVSLWFLAKNKTNGYGQDGKPLRNRSGEILFIDARKLGRMPDRTHRTLDAADIERIAGTYHAWRGDDGAYTDIPGFCKAASLDEVRTHSHVLTPGRYVGAEAAEEDDEPFVEKLTRLNTQLNDQFHEAVLLQESITLSLRGLLEA
jgi:type I restriction enzyme M protein